MARQRSVPAWREPVLDVARGLAVLGMVYLHLVATEGGDTVLERVAAGVGDALYGKPAALFCVLAGVSWAIQAGRRSGSAGFGGYVARRALALGLLGIVFGRTVWPTEILTPLALMMPLTLVVLRGGALFSIASIAVLLAAVPFAHDWFGDHAWSDWNEDGSHVAETTWGWVTLRYYLYTGNYPLLPWLVFPLLGALAFKRCQAPFERLDSGDRTTPAMSDRSRVVDDQSVPGTFRSPGWLVLAIALLSIGWVRWAAAHEEGLGAWAPQLMSVWVPTSVPFVLVGASTALLLVGVLWRVRARVRWLACIGRASLTHYVLHVLVVFVPLRAVWPDEDWSIAVGLWAFAAYAVVAAPLTVLWFRRFRRGPLEALWARVSGA